MPRNQHCKRTLFCFAVAFAGLTAIPLAHAQHPPSGTIQSGASQDPTKFGYYGTRWRSVGGVESIPSLPIAVPSRSAAPTAPQSPPITKPPAPAATKSATVGTKQAASETPVPPARPDQEPSLPSQTLLVEEKPAPRPASTPVAKGLQPQPNARQSDVQQSRDSPPVARPMELPAVQETRATKPPVSSRPAAPVAAVMRNGGWMSEVRTPAPVHHVDSRPMVKSEPPALPPAPTVVNAGTVVTEPMPQLPVIARVAAPVPSEPQSEQIGPMPRSSEAAPRSPNVIKATEPMPEESSKPPARVVRIRPSQSEPSPRSDNVTYRVNPGNSAQQSQEVVDPFRPTRSGIDSSGRVDPFQPQGVTGARQGSNRDLQPFSVPASGSPP
jgi:hypothetical protein